MADLLLSCRVVLVSRWVVVPAPFAKPLRKRCSSRLDVSAHEQRTGSERWDASCVRGCPYTSWASRKTILDCPASKLNCSMPGSVSAESSSSRERRSPIGVRAKRRVGSTKARLVSLWHAGCMRRSELGRCRGLTADWGHPWASDHPPTAHLSCAVTRTLLRSWAHCLCEVRRT